MTASCGIGSARPSLRGSHRAPGRGQAESARWRQSACGSDYRRAMDDLVETLRKVQKTPGMWGLHGAAESTRYRTMIGFIEGIDIGTSRARA
jgi:hypothetical protein